MTTATLHKPPAYVAETPQDAGILVLLATLGLALLVVGTLAVLFVLTLSALSIGG
ncbi:MAG: hypothetical protein NTW58_02795 [Actinobacteria bacterium]|nr:hypothetical protein [Actinomycetota bacterium]